MELNGLKKITLEYEDSRLFLQGEELEKWKKNLSTILQWAGLHNYNLLENDPAKYERLDIEENNNTFYTPAETTIATTPPAVPTETDEVTVTEAPAKKLKKTATK